MDGQNNAIAPMELPVAEETEETIFNLLGNSRTTTVTLVEIPTTDVADTQLPMDSNNITPPETQELQDVTDLLAEVEATVNPALTTTNPTNPCSHNNNRAISMDGQICQQRQQEQMEVHALQQHNRLLQTPPSSVSPHLPRT